MEHDGTDARTGVEARAMTLREEAERIARQAVPSSSPDVLRLLIDAIVSLVTERQANQKGGDPHKDQHEADNAPPASDVSEPGRATTESEAIRLTREWRDYWLAQNEPKLVKFTDLVLTEIARLTTIARDIGVERGRDLAIHQEEVARLTTALAEANELARIDRKRASDYEAEVGIREAHARKEEREEIILRLNEMGVPQAFTDAIRARTTP